MLTVSPSLAPIPVRSPKRARTYLRESVASRFWAKVDRSGPTPAHCPELGPCHVWLGSTDDKGYGQIREGGKAGRLLKAHRVSWALHNGPLADDRVVLHRCDNPPCVRFDHLVDGTQAENSQDAAKKGRLVFQTRPSLCPRGERHKSAKLTASDVAEIRRLRIGGWTQTRLASAFGVTQAAVWNILSGRTWRGVGA